MRTLNARWLVPTLIAWYKTMDKRALTILVIGVVVCLGIPLGLSDYASIEGLSMILQVLLGSYILLLPCLLALIARSHPYLWGFAPLAILLVYGFVYVGILHMHRDLIDQRYGWAMQIPIGVVICGAASSVGFAIRFLRELLIYNATPPADPDDSPPERKE